VPILQKDAGYDSLKDFTPVSLVSTAPLFVVVNGAVPAGNVRQLIDYAKAQPNLLEYATAGIGSLGHLSSELFARAAGVRMTHVPYKGQAPTTNAVLTGEVKVLITTSSAAMNSHIAAGKLKLLAISSAEPSPLAPPGTPLVSQTLPGYVVDIWFGILGPAGMPADVVGRLNDAIGKALAQPDVQTRFTGFGVVATHSTPKRLAELIAEEVPRWTQVVREAGIRAE
jgi:tripartite-type tricarboxylate transporter receptor subunit TctC